MTSGDGVVAELYARSHRVSAGELPSVVDSAGRRLGLSGASVYLVDLQQSRLVALLARDAPAGSSTLDSTVPWRAWPTGHSTPRNSATASRPGCR